MKPKFKTFTFDTTAEYAPHWAARLASMLSGVVDARYTVELVGPGGGNPCFLVEVPREAESAWRALTDELSAGQMSWLDEKGETHDHG